MNHRPPPWYRARIAFGNFVKGQLLQPTGLYKDQLLHRGMIELVEAAVPPAERIAPAPELAAPAPVHTPVAPASYGREIKNYSNRRK